MTKNMLIINYGELNLKGKNRPQFIKILRRNIHRALKAYGDQFSLKSTYDHIYIDLKEMSESAIDELVLILQDVSGIHSFGRGLEVSSDPDLIIQTSFDLLTSNKTNAQTFKIITKRIDKSFYPISEQMNRDVASKVLKNSPLRVDVHHPDLPLNIKIYPESTYIYYQVYAGSGGLPLGTGKKAMMLLSGGIDSPVAAYLMMKRGISLDFIHFAAPPYTSQGVIDKLHDILKILNRYQANIRLFIVPFTEIQETIYKYTDESYAITLLRRKMYEISARVAQDNRCLALANGESIGQVASQTLASMNVINEVTNIPVLRPLLAMDKEEIMKIARKLKTYDISIRPFVDCCTIFAPIKPKTAPNLRQVKFYESKVDYEPLIQKALENIEVIRINENQENEIDAYLDI